MCTSRWCINAKSGGDLGFGQGGFRVKDCGTGVCSRVCPFQQWAQVADRWDQPHFSRVPSQLGIPDHINAWTSLPQICKDLESPWGRRSSEEGEQKEKQGNGCSGLIGNNMVVHKSPAFLLSAGKHLKDQLIRFSSYVSACTSYLLLAV